MNKHGQTLIVFVILIPLMLAIAAFVVDIGIVVSNKSHLKEVTEMVIRDNINNLSNENLDNNIKKVFEKNDIEIDNLVINSSNNSLRINNLTKVESIFGSIIGIKEYEIKVDIEGYLENNKVIIKKY